jgi:hypothetical protein
MKGLQLLSTPQQIDSFAALWNLIQTVQLSGEEDKIIWNLSSDHAYSAASSYEACFRLSNPKPDIAAVWDVKIEGNIQFFLWLMVQNRLWTADRLEHRGWPHQDACSFCDQTIEDRQHLFLGCSYTKEVWEEIQRENPVAGGIACRSNSVSGWWKKIRRFRKNKATRDLVTVAVYGMWHLWKERNRRIFENVNLNPLDLAFQIRDGLRSFKLAYSE